ncbi:HEAT repeat domain-containing protein [Chitinophaga nivalis]|uniref:HEAT repeat domain-containing protein n=1 Tax=Chitinophaga nivalis TaxID=2991709 RepID=A0ABT3IK59_9BACT|nr:hypothetical protein [Chitinophaga nivalis]MCW3465963.1 hypothetical protein [Chitinophaga nivalis]MCW3484346.1 hypothetical protein [Chitinophaga nivalis]
MNEQYSRLLQEVEEGEVRIDDTAIALLNELLITPGHYQHQAIAKLLQDIKSPTTIPFVKQALESHFDYLEYTCSDDNVIAKWFSWLLYEIGTPDAIHLIAQYTQSTNEGIRYEMSYRLNKIKSTTNS